MGVRSPPLREMAKRCEEGLAGETPGIMWRAVFSEGRTLCARVARPYASPGMAWPPRGRRRAGGLPGTRSSVSNGVIAGVRSPPLATRPGGWKETLWGELRDKRKWRSSERAPGILWPRPSGPPRRWGCSSRAN